MTKELDLAAIFTMKTVANICCPQPKDPCPTCDGQGTVDYEGATDGTQMDCPACQ